MRTLRAFLSVGTLAAVALASCAPVDDVAAPESESTEEVRAAGAVYLRVRPDYRRCVSPLCGGWWVSRVNQRTTRCADGTWAAECYVAAIDWSATGLSDADRERTPVALLRGRVEAQTYGQFGNLGRLVVTEAWRAATTAEPSGTFYAVVDEHIQCVRAPCIGTTATRLNGITPATRAALNLDGVAGASRADLRAVADTLRGTGNVLVAGRIVTETDAATRTSVQTLRASQFYLRVGRSVADADYCAADADCTMTQFNRPVSSAADCYCAFCPNAALTVTQAEANVTAYQRYCRDYRTRCPVPRCIVPPTPRCTNHVCVAVPRP
jgi:hypothetical protein